MDSTKRFLLWNPPPRPQRLNAHRLLSICRSDCHITKRVTNTLESFDDLAEHLQAVHKKAPVDRFKEEALIAAFEEKLHCDGRPKLTDQQLVALRRSGFGLNVESEFYEVWNQCVAQFHSVAKEQLPESVRLLVGGLGSERSTLTEAISRLLGDEVLYRRVKKVPLEKRHDLPATVARQWAQMNGRDSKRDQQLVEKLIVQDVDHKLADPPKESYARLASSALDLAKQLASAAGFGEDRRFIFYVFRCLQRIAAYTVKGRVRWQAEWLRGAKTNERAIPGASTLQAELGDLLRKQVLKMETPHSGSKGTAATYKVRLAIPLGELGHEQVAKELGLKLNKKGVPQK